MSDEGLDQAQPALAGTRMVLDHHSDRAVQGDRVTDDWIEAELRAKRKEQEEERRWRRYLAEQRTTRLGYFATAIGIGLVIGAIVLGIAWLVQDNAERDHKERVACNQAGGTYIPLRPEGQLCLVGVEQR